jgi:hypothetical protein
MLEPPSQREKKRTSKVKFTPVEDQIIIGEVARNGPGNWHIIASLLANRTGRQVRERYLNYLSPTVTLNNWTDEEDQLLERYAVEYNKKWSTIAKFFPGRTDVLLKNRYAKLMTPKSRPSVPKTAPKYYVPSVDDLINFHERPKLPSFATLLAESGLNLL